MTVERVAAIVALLTPILVAAAAGTWKVATFLLARQDDTEPPIPQGQLIQPAPESWAARAAYDRALELLEDERADHARTIDRHRACHDLMAANGIPVPDDH